MKRSDNDDNNNGEKRAKVEKIKEQLRSLVWEGDVDGMQELVSGIPPTMTMEERADLFDNDGTTSLHYAAENGHVPVIEWLLSEEGRAAGFNMVLSKSVEGQTALHVALIEGDSEVCAAIVLGSKIENGERWQLITGREEHEATATPLNLAALEGSLEICQLLVTSIPLENGERAKLFKVVDSKGWTMFHVAAKNGRADVISWLVEGEDESPSEEASGFKYEDLFGTTNDAETALHLSAAGGHTDCFDSILAHCRSQEDRVKLFTAVDKRGWTVFHHAARGGQANFISHLLRAYPTESQLLIDNADACNLTVLHRMVIKGLDEESREEWRTWDAFTPEEVVVSALLGKSNSPSCSSADPNVALKFS